MWTLEVSDNDRGLPFNETSSDKMGFSGSGTKGITT